MNEPTTIHKTGDRVRISFQGRAVEAVVVLASPNGRSLFLEFDALLGGYVGQMPVLWEEGAFYDLIRREPVTIEKGGR